MNEGSIKSIVSDRGFGFVRTHDEDSVFFHVTDLGAGLEFGEQLIERRVKFDIIQTGKGPRARNVRPAD